MKKDYSAPKITVHGSLVDLTKAFSKTPGRSDELQGSGLLQR